MGFHPASLNRGYGYVYGDRRLLAVAKLLLALGTGKPPPTFSECVDVLSLSHSS